MDLDLNTSKVHLNNISPFSTIELSSWIYLPLLQYSQHTKSNKRHMKIRPYSLKSPTNAHHIQNHIPSSLFLDSVVDNFASTMPLSPTRASPTGFGSWLMTRYLINFAVVNLDPCQIPSYHTLLGKLARYRRRNTTRAKTRCYSPKPFSFQLWFASVFSTLSTNSMQNRNKL